jgi:glycine cleavage system transcriptional repressor
MPTDRAKGIVKPAGKQTPGDNAPRPATNENYLLISAFAAANHSPLVAISKRISDCGCNLAEARVASLGSDLSVLALAQGSWDAIAKLENALARLERDGYVRGERSGRWSRTALAAPDGESGRACGAVVQGL